MARRRSSKKREVEHDLKHNSVLVAHFVNHVMKKGKKSTAQKIVYSAIEEIGKKTKEDPLEVLVRAMDNVKPKVEVKSRRVGGATYQVPTEVPPERQQALALRWVIQYSKSRKGVSMGRALAMELLDAYNNQGNAIRKRDDTHKMAQAN